MRTPALLTPQRACPGSRPSWRGRAVPPPPGVPQHKTDLLSLRVLMARARTPRSLECLTQMPVPRDRRGAGVSPTPPVWGTGSSAAAGQGKGDNGQNLLFWLHPRWRSWPRAGLWTRPLVDTLVTLPGDNWLDTCQWRRVCPGGWGRGQGKSAAVQDTARQKDGHRSRGPPVLKGRTPPFRAPSPTNSRKCKSTGRTSLQKSS